MDGIIEIEIGGQKRTLEFNTHGVEMMTEEHTGDTASSFHYALIWGGLCGHYKAEKKRHDFTWRDVINWVDALPKAIKKEMFEQISETLMSTQAWKNNIAPVEELPVDENETPEAKKKESKKLTTVT